MTPDQIWQAIDTQRERVARLLEGLPAEAWTRPSLCDGWTVRDVAAHLTLQQLTLGEILRGVARSPGDLLNINRATSNMAKRQAALPTGELIARIRGMIGSQRHNFGVTRLETLIDITVHGKDIALPLGLDLRTDPEPTAVAAARVWELRWPFYAKKRFSGYRLQATDIDWSIGEGREVTGPIEALLLVGTGRRAALGQLSGEGAAALAESPS